MIFKLTVILIANVLLAATGQAKMSIITTTSDLRNLVETIGGDKVSVESLTKGFQDPHHLEAKPSYIVKLRGAQLLVTNGLGLESAWLPKALQGARNPDLVPGKPGYFDAGSHVSVLEIPPPNITRADGDVHPEGNPHITLDPVRAAQLGETLAERLSQLDPESAPYYRNRAADLSGVIAKKVPEWSKRLKNAGVSQVITYHKTLNYFLNRFEITSVSYLEPHPGVAPTTKHILSVIGTAKQLKIKHILVENFFSTEAARRVAGEVGSTVYSVPVAVNGIPAVVSLIDLYEFLVATIEGKTT